jgi:hypothetical protein
MFGSLGPFLFGFWKLGPMRLGGWGSSGWVKVHGRVVRQPHSSKRPISTVPGGGAQIFMGGLVRGLGNLVMVMCSVVLGIITAIQSAVFSMAFKTMNPANLTSQALSPLRSLFRPRSSHHAKDVTVHDVVVLDQASGRQVWVTIVGEFVGTAPGQGDEVEIEGVDQQGTLYFRRGKNLSVGLGPGGAEIRVRRGPWF